MMTMFKQSLLVIGSAIAVAGLIAATPIPAMAQTANPCAPKAAATKSGDAKTKAANPCAAKPANPCAPKAANPCAPKK